MVDVVFTGGRVVDVRTCTSRIANVAVEHGKIVDISAHELPAKRVVDAAGLVVAPGFIDVRGHLDGLRLCFLQVLFRNVPPKARLIPKALLYIPIQHIALGLHSGQRRPDFRPALVGAGEQREILIHGRQLFFDQ